MSEDNKESKNEMSTSEPDPKEFREKFEPRLKDINTFSDLTTFLEDVMTQEHGYSSICEAFILGMEATMKAMDRHENGGITGFQHGWILGQHYMKANYIKHGIKIINYDDFLYPQYKGKFTRNVIKRSTFKSIQKEAIEKLKKSPDSHKNVLDHWKSLAEGKAPFGFEVED